MSNQSNFDRDPSGRPVSVLVAGSDSPAWFTSALSSSPRLEPVGDAAPGVAAVVRAARRHEPDLVALPAAPWAGPAAAVLRSLGWRTLAIENGRPAEGALLRFADGVVSDPGGERPEAAADAVAAAAARAAARPGAARDDGPPVAVVSTVLNEIRDIDALIERVLPQLRDDDEFVIADGGSDDGTYERLQEWAGRDPRIRVLVAPGTNVPAGRNVAIEAVTKDVIACTDAGCTPGPGWLDALRRPFAEPDVPGLVAGTPSVLSETPLEHAQALACYADPADSDRPSLLVRLYGRYLGQVLDPTLPFARDLSFTHDAWREVGGFPEELDWVEDGVFGRSISERRDCLLTRDAHVSWNERLPLKKNVKMYYEYGLGSAESGNRQLQARDAARAVAYVAGPALPVLLGRRGLAVALAGAAVYYSLPLRRVARHRAGWRTAACVPLAMGAKDLAKVAGAVHYYYLAKWKKTWT